MADVLIDNRNIKRTYETMTWPYLTPDDLRNKLETVMGYRSNGSTEVWMAVKEGLEEHDVPAPDSLPKPQKSERFFDQ